MKVNHAEIRERMKKKRLKKHFTKKDVMGIIEASKVQDWKAVHESKLYNKHSGDYCSLLEVLTTMKLI